MILLDTNVLSALMQRVPEPAVVAWLDRQSDHEIWTSSVNVFEVEYGLSLMPPGKRRIHLEGALMGLLVEDLRGRILDFNPRAASEAGRLMAKRKREGREYNPLDSMIAAIALTRQATIATRNVRHFGDLPIAVVNPWEG
jgi:predicted nucleic acid-binding protein